MKMPQEADAHGAHRQRDKERKDDHGRGHDALAEGRWARALARPLEPEPCQIGGGRGELAQDLAGVVTRPGRHDAAEHVGGEHPLEPLPVQASPEPPTVGAREEVEFLDLEQRGGLQDRAGASVGIALLLCPGAHVVPSPAANGHQPNRWAPDRAAARR